MPFNNTLQTAPIQSIIVLRDERQRREINTEGLEQSISKNGLINPIVVRSEGPTLILLAGERRLQACRNLGWTEVPIRLATDLTEVEAQIIELEENAKREDLDWKDLVRAVNRIHNLHTQLEPNWTQEQTAEAISQSPGNLSLLLAIFPYLTLTIRTKPISSCTSYREAYNIIKTHKERNQAALFNDLISDLSPAPSQGSGNGVYKLGDPPLDSQFKALAPVSPRRLILEETILPTSFIDWAPTYTGPKFTVLHIDFPYGQTERGPQQLQYEPDIYEDSPQIYIDLLDCFCTNLDRFFSFIGWIMFWYSERMGDYTKQTIRTRCPSLTIQTHPLIWVHSDNVGISADSRRRPRHIYDTCLLMSRGDIPIAQIVSDAYSSPTDRSIHPHCKPVPMLKHFFRMLIDEQTDLFDPTCGSGSSLRAAEELGARSVLGLETNPDYRESAIQSLTNSRHFQTLEAP